MPLDTAEFFFEDELKEIENELSRSATQIHLSQAEAGRLEAANRRKGGTMINKQAESTQAAAVADIPDGATVMIGGFGEAGSPIELIHALIDHGARHLTVISNNTGSGRVGLAALDRQRTGAQDDLLLSAQRQFDGLSRTLPAREKSSWNWCRKERWPNASGRAARESRPFTRHRQRAQCWQRARKRASSTDRNTCMEHGLRADFALVKAARADRHGNLVYNKTARNFAPMSCAWRQRPPSSR